MKAAKGDKRKGAGKGTGGKATTQTSNIKLGQPALIANKKVKAGRSNGKTMFCSFFNQKGCTKGAGYTFGRACNVLTSPNAVCGKNHLASKHVGGTVAA